MERPSYTKEVLPLIRLYKAMINYDYDGIEDILKTLTYDEKANLRNTLSELVKVLKQPGEPYIGVIK